VFISAESELTNQEMVYSLHAIEQPMRPIISLSMLYHGNLNEIAEKFKSLSNEILSSKTVIFLLAITEASILMISCADSFFAARVMLCPRVAFLMENDRQLKFLH
jgi:hypothetical protein